MTFSDFIRKISSRKLWAAIAGVALGIASVVGADGSDIQAICGMATTLISAAIYMIVEGKVDAARFQKTAIEVIECAEELKDDE